MANTKCVTLREIWKVIYFPILKIRHDIFKGLLFHVNGAVYVNIRHVKLWEVSPGGGGMFFSISIRRQRVKRKLIWHTLSHVSHIMNNFNAFVPFRTIPFYMEHRTYNSWRRYCEESGKKKNYIRLQCDEFLVLFNLNIVACFPHAVTVEAIETSKGMQQ
jgi:hypothetical protein